LKPTCVSLGDLHYISLFSTYSGAYLLKDEILGGPLMFFFFPKKGDGMKGNYTILKIIPDDLSISYLQKLKVISTWFVDLIPISTSIPKHSNSPGQKDIFFFLAACPKSSILLVKVTLKSHISNLLSCHFLSEHLQGSPAK